MSYEIKTPTDVKNQIIEQMRDGLVRIEREEYIYDQTSDIYILSGAVVGGVNTPRVVEIISIEGIDEDGNWVPPTGSFNGISAWSQGEGQIAGEDAPTVGDSTINYWMYWSGTEELLNQDTSLYDGDRLYYSVRWNNTEGYRPKDGTIFRIIYKIYNAAVLSNLNNFSDGTVVTSLIEAFSTYLSELDNNNYNIFRNSFVRTAEGNALDELSYPWGLTRTSATKTTGYVYITNNTGDTLSIVANHRFTIADKSLVFKPTTFTDISDGDTGYVLVEATTAGKDHNVAPTIISRLWLDTSLETQVSNVTVVNPAAHLGGNNLFNDGADRETDEQLRARIYRAAVKQGSATYSAIEASVEDVNGVSECRVYDLENKPFVAENYIHVFVVGTNKLITDTSVISAVTEVVRDKRPVGTRYLIYQPTLKWVYIEMDVTPDSDWWQNRTLLNASIENEVDEYIDTLGVGDDIIYSQIIEEAMKPNGVYGVDITDFDITTYSYTPYSIEHLLDLQFSGSEAYAAQFKMGTKSYRDVYLFSGAGTYNMSGSEISSVAVSSPLVYRAKQDNDGVWVRDPLYIENFYSSNTSTTITITSGTSGSQDPYLTGGEDLIFIYENYEYVDIDAVILNVSGTIGDVIQAQIWSGTNAGPVSQLGSGTQILDYGTPYDYYIKLADRITLIDPTDDHWLVVSGTSFNGSNTYIGTDADGNRPISGEYLYVWHSSGAWDATAYAAKHAIQMPISGTDNAIVDDIIWKSEIANLYDMIFTNSAKV